MGGGREREVTLSNVGWGVELVELRKVSSMVLLLLCSALLGCNSGPTAPDEDDFGVLFIGNSLTTSNELPDLVEKLLKEAGVDGVHVDAVAYPNFGLPDHWIQGDARDAIALGGWDVVVMQQGPSATEGRPSLLEYS
jgi:hypothetical protein